jgi:hypothetical protein
MMKYSVGIENLNQTGKGNFMDTKKAAGSEELSAALINPYICYLTLDADRLLVSVLPPPAPPVYQTIHKSISLPSHNAEAHSRTLGLCQATTTHFSHVSQR